MFKNLGKKSAPWIECQASISTQTQSHQQEKRNVIAGQLLYSAVLWQPKSGAMTNPSENNAPLPHYWHFFLPSRRFFWFLLVKSSVLEEKKRKRNTKWGLPICIWGKKGKSGGFYFLSPPHIYFFGLLKVKARKSVLWIHTRGSECLYST
jgi:hypothetical protein